ncbi:MAG: non-ribosomal peptide synthetase, partial [Bacillota bacterium]|nr:non-ribosomal peptide synthetase [Bacillota bacterium]
LFIANPVLWFQKINTYRIDAVMSPNFGIKHFLMNFQDKMANDWDLSCLRMIVTGAEPTNVSMCQEFLKRMKPYKLNSRVIVSGYGLAEYTVAACVSKPLEPMGVVRLNSSSLSVGEKVKYASEGDSRYIELLDVGYPIGDTQVRIVDSNNNILQEDYYGYIQLKGRSVTSGYYNNEKDSSNLFTEDGWLNTGDLGFLRKQKLVIMGRSKEVIIINGHNLYPYDIERVAEKLELVGEGNIAVCGVNKQGKNREEILGCVQYEGIIEDFVPVYEQLKKYINEKMGIVLDYILPIKKIPKTSSGKIKRVQLSKDFESGEMDAVKTKLDSLLSSRKNCNGVGDLTQTEIELKRVCGKFFNAYDIGVDDNFLNYGISSIVITQLTQYLNEIFNKKIKTSDFFAYCTIRKLAEYIDQDEDNEFIESRYKTDFISIEKEAVKTLAREIDVLKETIVIGVYCYTLKYILKESVIPLIVQTKQDESKSLIVDTEAFSKMDDFFHNIQEQVKNIGSVGPQFNENASVKDMDIYLDNKDRYKELDLRLTIEEEADLVKLSFCYDSLKVRINTIKELIFNYEKLLNKMIAK